MVGYLELMDATEVCNYLQITHNHLHQLTFRKKLVWKEKRGKKIYFDRLAVEAYKEKK